MKILLDTHTMIWALCDDPKLNEEARSLILNEANTIYVSVISFFEIALKARKYKDFEYDVSEIVNLCQRSGYIFLSLGLDPILKMNSIHAKEGFEDNNDPFDNLLVAQSVINNMMFLTHDFKIKNYDVQTIKYF